jgi:tRNA pseudouridine32 synthase/23S rRNA pseudouridine746 synthase
MLRELCVFVVKTTGIRRVQKFILTRTVGADDPATACEFLAAFTPLSKSRIKDAMAKGAVWLKKSKRGQQRIRRASTGLGPGDRISIYYNSALLAITPPRPQLISDQKRFSVWLKPAGLLSQGTKYGDHCALLRQVEQVYRPRRKVYLVHRLDREASGLVLLAHNKTAAARISDLFQKQHIVKRYAARVRGNPAESMPGGVIAIDLDGKAATTEFRVEIYESATDTSTVQIVMGSGRKHQIRRHFDIIGHPVMGDPSYGKGNKNSAGLQLVATGLEFQCPFTEEKRIFETAAEF